MAENIFFQISIIFGITVSIALVMRLLRQPLIIAYIIAGLAAGPLFLNLVSDSAEFFSTFAEFGIVLLLFIVGLSLNFDYVRRMGKAVLFATLSQFVLTVFFGFVLMYFLGFGAVSSLFLSIAFSFSSTIIVTKLLSEKKDTETVYGRFIVGVLLIQDAIAVLVLIFLNTWHGSGEPWYETLAITGGKGLLLVGLVFMLARYLLPKLMDRVAKSGELLFIFTVAWCFGVASLVYWAGFSIEVGAIIAGISLGASPYQPEISSRLRPLRDFFIVLFFIVLGSELSVDDMSGAVVPALAISLFVIVVDPIVLYLAMRCLSHTRRSSLLAGITSAQVSEFGFILVFTGMELGYLHGSELAILTLTALITIIISSYLITYNERIYLRFLPLLSKFGKDKMQLENEAKEIYDVWVFGYHRMGWKVCEALAAKKVRYAVVDYNPAAIAKLKHRGIPAYFGDAADVEFLSVLSLEKAKLVISTIPEADDQKAMIQYVRKLSDKPIIIASLFHNFYLDDLYEAGANYVMMPHLLGGQWMSEVLRGRPWSRGTFKKLRQEQREELKLRYTVGAH